MVTDDDADVCVAHTDTPTHTAMPELPDVEALRAAVERECQGRRLLRVELKEQGGGPREGLFDDAVFDKVEEAEVKRAMEGAGADRVWIVDRLVLGCRC